MLLLGTGPAAFSQFTVYNTSNSDLPSNTVGCVEGRNPNVDWVGTYQGLARISGSTWTVYDEFNSEIPTNTASAVGVSSNGNMYVGTFNGFSMFNGNAWTDLNDNVSSFTVYEVEVDNTDRVLVGPYLGGLGVYDGTTWVQYKTLNSGIPSDDVRAIAVDNTGLIWVGTVAGLASFDGTTWTVYTVANSDLPYNNVEALAVAPDNTIWIGTGGGLASFNGSWTVYTTSNSDLPSNSVDALCVDAAGGVWVGSEGLSRFNGSTWTTYTTTNSNLPSNGVNDLDINAAGTLLIATGNGFAKLSDPVGISESPAQGPSFGIRPNPACDAAVIVLDAAHGTNGTLCIFDLNGRPVSNALRTGSSMQLNVDLTGLAAGSYLVRLSDTSGSSVRSLVIAR